MKILKINLFIFCCILAVFLSSCKKESEVSPTISSLQNSENRKYNNDFFSNESTYARLASTAHNWKKANKALERSDEETVDELKSYVDDLDILLNDKYVNKIIGNAGYPLWDASKIYLLANEGKLVFTPIFKENSDKINSIFVFSNFGTDESSYTMMTRKEMEVIANDPKDPNFHLLSKIYKEFDNELFALDLPQYDDWAVLALPETDACYIIHPMLDDDFVYAICSSGCIDDLLTSGIVDEIEEFFG